MWQKASLILTTINTNSPFSHDISAEQDNTAILKPDGHIIEIFMNSQAGHLEKSTHVITVRIKHTVRQLDSDRNITYKT